MDAWRFVSAIRSKINSRQAARTRKICRSCQSLIEGLESRVLLSGTLTVTANQQAINFGENTPSLANFTDFYQAPDDASITQTRTFSIGDLATASGSLTFTGSSPVTLSGANAADFTLTQPAISGNVLAPGSTATFSISFTPTSAEIGTDTATVTIASSDSTHPNYTFDIQAEAVPAVSLSGGLEYYTDVVGSNEAAAADGDLLVMDYTGYLTSGVQFDTTSSSGTHNYPFEFDLGAGQVIQGWDQGLVGMQLGETRTLFIPSTLGYGANGSPPTIPGGATLVFVVTLQDIVTVSGVVNSSNVVIPNGEASPSAGNGTNFGVFDNGSAAVTENFVITDYANAASDSRGLQAILADPAVTLSGVGISAFSTPASVTTTQPTINTTDFTGGDVTTANFTITYTPSPGISDATVNINNLYAITQGAKGISFEVQGQGNEAAIGYVDGANWGEIYGWAYDPENPTAPINIQITIDGGLTQTFSADVYRGDLTAVIGTPNHGFQYYMPFLSVGTHTYTVTAIDTTTNTDILLGSGTVVSQNSLFDEGYYLREYPAVAAAVTDGQFTTGYQHYLEYGQYEGYSPSPYWDESYYLMENPDVAAAVADGKVSSGFMQYYLYGQYEGRGGLLYFNNTYYLNNYANVGAAVTAGTVTSAFQHFCDYGQYEGYNPMLYFSFSVYDTDNGDIAPYITGEPFTSAYDQFVEFGQYENRTASNYFNETVYLEDNPDVAAAVTAGKFPTGFQHWLLYGQYEGRTA